MSGRITRISVIVLGAGAFAACSGDGIGEMTLPDAGAPPDLAGPPDLAKVPDLSFPPRDPSAHPDSPSIHYGGGRLLKQVEITTIGWSGDPLNADREAFGAWMVDSTYYDVLKEYGIQHGKSMGLYEIPDAPPKTLDDSSVGPLLRKHFADGSLPAPTAQSLYLIYLPNGTQSTQGGGGKGCRDYDGYHWQASTGLASPKTVPYAIMVGCGQGSRFTADTVTASHEIGEAVTDADGGHGWLNPSMPLSEIGDLCTPLELVLHASLKDGSTRDYRVQRLWSAQAAADGTTDPCVPAPPAPYVYFGAGIDPGVIDVTTDDAGNGEATLLIEPFAYGDVGTINWQFDLGPAKGVAFSKTKGSGLPGSTQAVKITVTPSARSGVSPVWLLASAKGYRNLWSATLYIH